MMKFYQVFWQMKFCQVFWLMKSCQVFSLSCLYRNDEILPGIKYLAELHHFCINMIVKIPGRTSSFLYKHDSQNTWQNFIISV
jgi:hypothetical protein